MRTLRLFLVISLLGLALAWAPGMSWAKEPFLGPQAVWNPAEAVLQQWLACRDAACKEKMMRANGASDQAIDFWRRSRGHLLTAFRELGRVDLAWGAWAGAGYQGQYYLLNGSPALLGVDDAVVRARKNKALDLTAHPGFARLRARHSKADLRRCRELESVEANAGGQRFVFSFYLKDGCDACPVLGTAYLAFDFDPRGKFTAIKLLGLVALR